MTNNEFLLSLEKTAEADGYEDEFEMIHDYVYESMCPACCKEGCEVEQDGHCEHGCPSIMIEMGMI